MSVRVPAAPDRPRSGARGRSVYAAVSPLPRGLVALIVGVTAIRLIVAALVPLAPDETYYWIWSHALAPGYVDHPPMVAVWIKAGTLVAGQTALGVRLLGPLAALAASWMLFDAARHLFPGGRAGVAAVVLLNASLLLGVGTVIMTPDSPLLFFWTATLWAIARVAAGGPGGWWLVAGVFGGLALDSKYTALFLWIGVGLWLLLTPAVRVWLRRWQPWAACAIGFLLFAPALAWNAAHAWAGFARQGGRVSDWRPARAMQFLAELVGGQIGLATPLVWALCLAGMVVAVRRAWRTRDPAWSLLAALSLPPVLVFLQHALGDRVQGNWPAIIYPALAIAAGGWLPRRGWWMAAAALGFGITALAYLQAAASLFPLPPRLDPIALRLAGWQAFAEQVEAARTSGGAAYVAVDAYAVASELAWWLPADAAVLGTDPRWQLMTLPTRPVAGARGLLLQDERLQQPPDPGEWTDARQIGTVDRPGAFGPGFVLYQVTAAATKAPLAELPHR